MKIIFELLADELRAAEIFASVDESHPALNGVHIELVAGAPPLLVTCDGRRLCLIKSETDPMPKDCAGQFTITHRVIAMLPGNISSSLPNRLSFIYDTESRCGSVKSVREGFTVQFVAGDGVIEEQFPSWRNVLPKSNKAAIEKISLSGAYIADFKRAAGILWPDSDFLRLNFYGEREPVEIFIENCRSFYGLLMPAKGEEEVTSFAEAFKVKKT